MDIFYANLYTTKLYLRDYFFNLSVDIILISREIKNITDLLLLKSTSLSAIAVSFFNTNNSAELQVLSAVKFSSNSLPRQNLAASLQNCVSDSTGCFSVEKLLFI